MKSSWIKFGLPLQIFFALGLGCITGFVFGPKTQVIGDAGLIFVKTLRALATPLVFFAVIETFYSTHIHLKQGVRLLGFSIRNAIVALCISFSLARLFPVGRFVNLAELSSAISDKSTHPAAKASHSILDLLSPNILYVIAIAIIIGILGRLSKSEKFEKIIQTSLKFVLTILGWLIKLVPLAIFAVVSKLVGASGFKFFSALVLFISLVTSGILLQVFVYYGILCKFSLKKSPLPFFKNMSPALLTALGTGSSLATLPVTLTVLQDKMKVSRSNARLSACIGTNFNHDGILLYEVTAAFFVAQIQGLDLTLTQQLTMAGTSLLAAVGIAGVPEAGLMTLSLVLSATGLPLNAVPFLLPVDWFLGRLRAFANVASDIVVAHLLD